jgi:hypothetical protein
MVSGLYLELDIDMPPIKITTSVQTHKKNMLNLYFCYYFRNYVMMPFTIIELYTEKYAKMSEKLASVSFDINHFISLLITNKLI